MRHVFAHQNQGQIAVATSNQQTQQQSYQQILNSNDNSNSSSSSSATSGTSTNLTQNGQYILVQRAGVIAGNNHSAPRASSAPPAQNQVSLINRYYLFLNHSNYVLK